MIVEKTQAGITFSPWLGRCLPFDIYSRDGTHILWFWKTLGL